MYYKNNVLKDKLPFEPNTSLVNGTGYGGKWLPAKREVIDTATATTCKSIEEQTTAVAPIGAETCCVLSPMPDWLGGPEKDYVKTLHPGDTSGILEPPLTFLTEPTSGQEYAAQCGLAEHAKKYDKIVEVAKKVLECHINGYHIHETMGELYQALHGGE